MPSSRATTFEDLYRKAIVRCLAANNTTWAENAFLLGDYPSSRESADALRHLVVRHLLKQCGDAEGAASILEALTADLGIPESSDQKFFRLLCRYAATELKAIEPRGLTRWLRSLSHRSESNAISLVMWGADYIARFDRYCARSLAAEGNIPALKAHGPVLLLVHTGRQDVEKIRNLPSLRRLGMNLRIWSIPDELLEVTTGDSKYWLLGALQSIHLFYAARRGANFLPLFPDALYSERYFESVAKLARSGQDAVFLSGFRAYRPGFASQLEEHYGQQAYAVPAQRLIELAFRNIDAFLGQCFLDPTSDTLPRYRMLFAHCGDHVEIHSPHYNPALIRNSVVKNAPARYLMTLDSEIDKILPPTSAIHFHSIEDDYFATELIDEASDPPARMGSQEYATFFVEHANSGHLRFQKSPYRLGIHPSWLTNRPQVSPDDAKLSFDRIYKLVKRQMDEVTPFERPRIVLALLKKFAAMDGNTTESFLIESAMKFIHGKKIQAADSGQIAESPIR
ncbi:MAG: hypothetical protein JO339_22065 [Alphaproteobacteria bacterium]|nr:hypothetical protein [Alphaproteobacteria bacterium]